MLVLSRRNGQRVVINENITLTVIAVHKGRVQLGIEAPKEIAVRREELAAKKKPVAA